MVFLNCLSYINQRGQTVKNNLQGQKMKSFFFYSLYYLLRHNLIHCFQNHISFSKNWASQCCFFRITRQIFMSFPLHFSLHLPLPLPTHTENPQISTIVFFLFLGGHLWNLRYCFGQKKQRKSRKGLRNIYKEKSREFTVIHIARK